jgi:hypothetical protein
MLQHSCWPTGIDDEVNSEVAGVDVKVAEDP